MFLLNLSGSISIDINNSPFLLIVFKDEIRIDIRDESIFNLLDSQHKDKKINFWHIFGDIREFAKLLSDKNITIIFSIKGKDVVILGKNASPSLSTIISKSKNIEIKNVLKLAKITFDALD